MGPTRATPQLAIWRQPWLQRRQQGELWGLALLLALTTLPVLIYAGHSGRDGLLPSLGLVWWVLLWWQQAAGLQAQNRPALAQLVPGQLRGLRLQLLLQGGLFVLLAAAGLALSLGEGPWILLAALGVTGVAWLHREPLLWLPLSLLPTIWPRGFSLIRWLDALPASQQLLLLAVMALLLAASLLANGPELQRRHRRALAWRAALRDSAEGRSAAPSRHALLRALAWPFVWPQAVHCAALLRRARPANALARLDHALSRDGHWTVLLWILALALLLVLGVVLLLQALLPLAAWDKVGEGARFGLCVGPFSLILSPALGRMRMLWSSRREQALLLLLPGLPQGPNLSLALARRWGLQHLGQWALVSLLVLGALALSHPPSLVYGAAFAAACLPLGLLQWRDAARLRGADRGWPQSMLPFAVLFMHLPATLAERFQLAPATSLAMGLGLSLLLGAWLWPRLRRSSLPAGRAAD